MTDKLIEFTEEFTYLDETIELASDGLLRGTGSKQVTVISSADPIVSVGSNVPDDFHKTAVIENIVLWGNEGNEKGVLLEDVYGCQIRNVSLKNLDTGILITATSGKWSEANRIEHVRMFYLNSTGIDFQKGDGTGKFGCTHIADVGISFKNSGTGIKTDSDCELYAPFIKANMWANQGTSWGISLDGTINAGLCNYNHAKTTAGAAGYAVGIGQYGAVSNTESFHHNSRFFVVAANLTAPVSNPYSRPADLTTRIC